MDAKSDGIGPDALKRARQRIGAGSHSVGFPRRTYWSVRGLSATDVTDLVGRLKSEHSSGSASDGESDPLH
jgi:hypothetical protein